MIEKEQIVKAIAERHQVYISLNDPIMAVFSMNDVIWSEYEKNLSAMLKKNGDEVVSNVWNLMERNNSWTKQENEAVAKYLAQIVRDYQIKFERSLDGTINTIKEWYMEIDQMKSSTALMAGATLIFMLMGSCAAAIINWWH